MEKKANGQANEQPNEQANEQERERLFIAVKLPPELGEMLNRHIRELPVQLQFAKWVHPADYHITLQFLGDTDVKDIPALAGALRGVAGGASPFSLALKEWGTFGAPSAPKVLWAGVGGDLKRLYELHRAVTAATQPLGFAVEERPYRPHLTLARKYRGEGPFQPDWLHFSAASDTKWEHLSSKLHWTVDGFMLYATRMCAIPMYENIENMTFF